MNTLVLNVAPLTQRVREYFNCSTAEGAYLENQGDSSTIGSHFERRIFGNELMTAGGMYDRRISQFTLALLEGTGWYKVDYSFAESMTYGKGQGCAFFDTPCMDYKTFKPNFKEFCSPLNSVGPSWSKKGWGFCGVVFLSNSNTDYGLHLAFDYWNNHTIVWDKYSDNCPTYYVFYKTASISPGFDCENRDSFGSSRLGLSEYGYPRSMGRSFALWRLLFRTKGRVCIDV